MRSILYTRNLFGETPIGITNGNITLKECSNQEADKIITIYHYSHKSPKNRFKSFSVNDGMGYLQLGYGIRPHMKHTISKLITTKNYCEFDRMWLSDDLPKFSESQTIGLLIRYLKIAYPEIKFIITYADESVGNKGTIYLATNAIKLDSVNVDFYVLPSGERVHPVTMWHRHKTRAWAVMQELYPGIKHIKNGYKQNRFLYILDKHLKKDFKDFNGL